jgi:hypothetical protein
VPSGKLAAMTATLTLAPRPVLGSVEELLAGASERRPMKNADSLSGSQLERVVIDGARFVVKYLHWDDDWIQRATGDLVCRPLLLWQSGLFDALPACLDHTAVAMAAGLGRAGRGTAILMHDVGPNLVEVARGAIPLEQHVRFLDHMAELHAAFWGIEEGDLPVELTPMGNRYLFLSSTVGEFEAARHGADPVPALLRPGWARFAEEAPKAASVVLPLLADPSPLVEGFAGTPMTLVHSDWKAGNLGSHPDGRTILLDWAFPGVAPATADLAWYLAVNCDLLPQAKEDAIDCYRKALEGHGVETGGWWVHQLGVALIGALAQLGWSKSGAELRWWEERVGEAASYLG